MKRTYGFTVMLLALILTLALLCGATVAAYAESAYDMLHNAQTLDEQLALLDGFATENAAELESGGWGSSYTLNLAPGLPDDVIPADWDTFQYTEAEGLPEAMRGHKFIAILCESDYDPRFAGDLLARFSADMRAASLAEAEYVLIVRQTWVPSGYNYIPPASSSHCDYAAFAVDLKTGEATRFWRQRNSAKRSGIMGLLNGDSFSQQELWNILRSQFLGELRHTQADGTVLVFGVTGKNCYLKGYETAGELTDLVVPGEVEGHTVTEIVESCFRNNETLKTVVLHDGLTHIAQRAFNGCAALEAVTLPDTLEVIGDYAFSSCTKLRQIRLPESLRAIGELAFASANTLTSLTLPGSLETMGEGAFNSEDKLAQVVVSDGITSLPRIFDFSRNIACCYLPASLTSGLYDAALTENATIYAPEGSYALTWAAENGRAYVACASPDDMPTAEYIVEGDCEFRVFNGEAALSAYLGSGANVVVPDTAGGLPVTRVLNKAIYELEQVESATLPQSIRTVNSGAIFAPEKGGLTHIYVTNPETSFEKNAIGRYGSGKATITIHAPEGSTAQRYVVDTPDEPLAFEPWGEGTDPNARSLSDALAVAALVQQSAASFWDSCDQTAYAWLKRVPGYAIDQPDAAAVLRVTQAQFDELALLMGGADDVATDVALIVNTQFDLPYAKAAARTAQAAKLDPVPDGSCAIVVLAYQQDIVLVTVYSDGSAHGALICSSPEVTKQLSAVYIDQIAARYGVAGECSVYDAGALAPLLGE